MPTSTAAKINSPLSPVQNMPRQVAQNIVPMNMWSTNTNKSGLGTPVMLLVSRPGADDSNIIPNHSWKKKKSFSFEWDY